MADPDMLDEPITVRDVLTLAGLVRDTRPRDGLRALEDALLDLATQDHPARA